MIISGQLIPLILLRFVYYLFLKIQRQIVEELNKGMEALERVKLLKEKAEKRIEGILEEVRVEN